MKALKIVGLVIVGLVVVVLLVGSLLPKDYNVERSIEIAAPPAAVFEHVNTLKRWDAWSPWIARDKTIKNAFSGPESGVGAKVTWTSDDSGSGSQTITASDAPRRIETALDFGGQGTAKTSFDFAPSGPGTRVTWGMQGEMSGPVGGIFASQMDGWIGSDYEDGLARLKRVVEGS